MNMLIQNLNPYAWWRSRMIGTIISMILLIGIAMPAFCLETGVLTTGENILSARLDNKVSLDVVTTITDRQECITADGWRWGSEDIPPTTSISSLTVTISKKKIFIPKSAYLDLGNPRSIAVKQQNQKIIIEISGGDAATAYKALLELWTGVLQERIVANAEFPDAARETTIYDFNYSDQ